MDLQGCIFGGNSAYDDGGALKCESDATLTNCSFGNNTAYGQGYFTGYGGAMDAYRSGTHLVINVNACSFSANQSIYGGGFSSENFDATFTDCYFIGNTAQEGGGLDLVNGDVSVTGGVVKGNNATDGDGGGFNCSYSTAEIRDCTISDNSADGIYPTGGNGGAINFYGGAPTQEVFNCLMTGNSATIDGGAVFCRNATPEIGNCTFSDNQAGGYGGAIFSDWASDPQITDSIFQNNNSHAIYEQNFGGNAIVKYSLFYDNPDYDYYESDTPPGYDFDSVADPNGNFNKDPLFLSGPLGEFYLNQTLSPAVDNGSVTAVSLGLDSYTTDAANALDSGQVDIGYHYIDIADADTFQLTTSVIGGQGTIEPETGSYYAGTVVTLTATPGAGWRIKAWSGTDDDSSTAETSSVVMNSDRTVTVEFDQPRTFIVAVGGAGGFYSNITDALHDAEDGDTIVVYAGTYYGPQVQVNKDVEIRSLHPDDPCFVAATIIDSTGHAGPVFLFDPARGPGCILNGFTIQNSTWWTNIGDDGEDPGENGGDGAGAEGGAIWIGPSASPVIKNCVIRDNFILGGFGGTGSDADETHNAGRGGWGGWARGGAIYCGTNSSPAFINCQIIDNQALGGIGGSGGDWDPVGGRANYGGNWSRAEWWNIDPRDLTVEWVQGDLWEKWDEMAQPPYGTVQESWYVEDGQLHWGYFGDYRWYSGYGGAVFINRGSNVTFTDCTISGNLAQGGLSGLGGDEPGGGPLRVKPFPLQYEIPSFGGGVYCAADTTVIFNGCTITGNMASDPLFNHIVALEGYGDEDDTLSDWIQEEYDPENPYSIDPYLGHGGGVCAEDTATVIFTDCTISENQASVGGGLNFADANPIISDCNFTSNSAFHGGGLFGDLGPASITGCNIFNNEAVSPPNDLNAVILGEGGGLHLWATEADIIDCYFSGNQAEASGGGAYFGGEGTPSLTNCLLANNTAGRDGGGVSTNIFSQLTISNCTIADNLVTGVGFGGTANYGGGLSCSYDSYTNIINSIIWGNLADSGAQLAIGTGFEYDPAPSIVNVSYSAIGPRYAYLSFISDDSFGGGFGGGGFGGGTTLVEGQTIYDQFDAGQETVKVIVSLFEPVEMREATDWDSPGSVGVLRAEIASRQSAVLSSLTSGEFTLRYRYDNQAGFSGEVTIGGLNKLLSNPSVAYIEPVRYVRPMLAQAIPLANALEARQVYDGTGIAVGIIDSGVDYTHPKLGNDGFPNSKVIGGYDTGNNDNDPMPVGEAHGTACAGIAAGNLGTVGDYIGGVAPNAKIYALKLTTDAGLWPIDFGLAAWDWCVTHRNDDPDNPIKVMSNSWGSLESYTSPSAAEAAYPALATAANTVVATGIALLASSGNEFQIDAICVPAAFSSVISVGAVDDVADTVMPYSNTADNLDILAPADPVYTTDIVGPGGYDPGDYYPDFGGTSSACPFAAGVVASLQSAAMAETGSYLTPAQVRNLLVISGDPVTDAKVAITRPRVNLGMAISYLTTGPIYIEEGCQIENDWWNPETQSWDPNSHNLDIDDDPNFVAGYYLSQIAAGQSFDSPCVDAGSDLASIIGLDTYTTRTDGVPDGNVQPLVEYLFDTDASDTSGYGYHGILGGDAVVSGGVLTMSGAGYIDIPALFGAVNPFDGSGDFTIQMDFQINTPNPGTVGDCAGGILISSARDDSPDNHSMSVYVRNWLDPYWSEVVYDNFWVSAIGTEDNPAGGVWHNINVAYSDTTQQTTIWLDGSNALAWGEPFNPAIPDIALDTVRLGGSLNTEFPYEEVGNLIGSIDNVRIIPDDSVIVDMGYHYPLFEPPRYELTVTAIEVSELPEEDQPVVEPNAGFYKWYTKVTLTVTTPVPDGYQALWTGTNDDESTEPTNTVTMDSDKVVTVTFVKDAYDLTVEVVGPGGSVSPIGTHTYPRGTVVNLTAYPDEGYRFKQWTGTDNDASAATTNTVTMYSDKTVTAEFELPATLTVPGDYSTIQEAIVAARDHDKIIIASGVYIPTNNGGFIIDKEIMLTSTNPDDPNVVALTVINPLNRAFTFTTNAGPGAILNGITIADGGFGAIPAEDGEDPGENGQDGFGTEGGAIYISTGSSPTIQNCIITGFNLFGGDAGSGADANEGFPGGRGGWAGWARGGGVYVASGSSPTFINCTISNCTATGGNAGDGANGAEDETVPWVQPPGYGGNWSDGILWQLWGYVGDYRYYSAYGGGVYCAQNSSPTFIACTITGNSTQGGMSGVGGLTAVTELITNPAISYEIPSYGGGVYCGAGSTVLFEGCTITNNEAPKPGVDEADEVVYHLDPYLGHGGGIAFEETASIIFEEYVSPITGEVRRCVISGNVASVGGGMYWANAEPEISDCNVSDNLAYQGGGLFGTNGSAIIENCIIQGNFAGTAPNNVDDVAGQGGGIYSASMVADIFDCNIFGNEAGASGGGIFFTGIDDSPIVTNCLITNNLAGRDGGGISVNWYSEPIIENCTVVGNEATGDFGEIGNTAFGGGLYCSYDSNSVVVDSIFWNNSAIEGEEIAVGTGFEFDPRPATLTITYSNVKGGEPGVRVDEGCTLNWDVPPSHPDYHTNINADPMFVTGPLGDYYLSQTDANSDSYPGQETDSPCVDAGSDYASYRYLEVNRYTTRTDNEFDKGQVDMGYHYLLPETAQPCRICDLVYDGIINFKDFAKFALHWLEEGCSNVNNWCEGADFTFDTRVDFEDFDFCFDKFGTQQCWLVEDDEAPIPNPSEWEIEPHSTSTTSIGMTAKTAVDAWGWNVEYYFQRTDANGNPDGRFRDWDPNSTYIDDGNGLGLDPNIEYGYRVKARDVQPQRPETKWNETEWSVILYAISGVEGPAEPPAWLSYVATPNSITLEVTTSDNGIAYVEYYFEETSGNPGGSDSDWQNEPNYTDTGLDPNTTYTYRVVAHDENGETTAWSDPCSVTTLLEGMVPDTTAPTPDPMLWAADGEPEEIYGGGGASDYYATMTAEVATDDLYDVQYRFICTTYGGFSSSWQSSPTYTKHVGMAGQAHGFYVIARDTSPNQNETGPSPTVAAIPRP